MSQGTFTMNKRIGFLSVFLGATGMGLAGLCTRAATRVDFFGTELVAGESIGALMTVGRTLTGLFIFLILIVATNRMPLLRATKISPAIVIGGLAQGASCAFYMVSALLTSLANSIFLIYTGPLFCTLLAHIFRKESISRFHGMCLGAVFVGMLLTSGVVSVDAAGVHVGLSMTLSTPEFPQKGLGDFLGLCSGALYGVNLLCSGYRKDCDSMVRGVWNFGFGTVGALVIAGGMLVVWPLGEVNMSATNWVFALVLWVVCGAGGLGMMLVAGRNLPAVELSTMAYWECMMALIISVVVYHEPMTAATAIGGALIILGGALPALKALRKG